MNDEVATKNESIIKIFDSTTGEVKNWKRLSARVKDFTAAFPPVDGWRNVGRTYDVLSLSPELVQLYHAAISAGQSPRDIGLPPLRAGVVFEMSLVSPEGLVVATGTSFLDDVTRASAAIDNMRLWEIYQSNSLNRLISILGYGGEQYDDDVSQSHITPHDRRELATDTVAVGALEVDSGDPDSIPDLVRAVGTVEITAVDESQHVQSAVAERVSQSSPASSDDKDEAAIAIGDKQGTEEPVVPKATVSSASLAPKRKATPTEESTFKPRPWNSAIRALAKTVGVPPIEVRSMEEAQAEMERLSKLR